MKAFKLGLVVLGSLLVWASAQAADKTAQLLNQKSVSFQGKNPLLALRYADSARKAAEASHDKRALFDAWRNQSIALSELGEPVEAETAIHRALRTADALNNDTLRASAGNTLGFLLMKKQDAKQALATFQRAYRINLRLKNDAAAHKNLLNLAILDYHFFDRPSRGINEFARVRSWARTHQDYALLNSVLSNLAGIAWNEGRLDEAKDLLEEAMLANTSENNISQRVYNLNQLASLNLSLNKPAEADKAASEALELAQQSGLTADLSCAYNIASDVQEARGNPAKALSYFRKATHLQDSINQVKRAQTAEFTAMVMDAERQVRENEVLRRDREIQQQKLTLQRTLMFFGGIIALVLAGLLLLAVNSNRKVRQLVELLRKQNHAIVAQKEEIQLLNTNLEAIVEERTSKLEERTRQILDYASYNSHIIRGPLARIMGLSYLMRHSTNEQDTRFYLLKMEESAHEMDHAIKIVSRKLELEESDYIGTLNDRTTIRRVPIMRVS